ncbi:MAG: hypothetical protein ISS45_03690 [Candidatus Omnitrophica bacterium]|nr:hypothetical protein [Candidatus Omnitrophota bacterium]
MGIKLINQNKIIGNFVITFIIFIGCLCLKLPDTMGSEADLKMRRDSGIIGEKKTVQGEKVSYDQTSGITYHVRTKGTFVTPKLVGDVAYFGLDGNLGYTFRLNCRDWKYNIKAYWSSPVVTEERVGFSVSLESPDGGTFIDIKEVDIPAFAPLSTSPTREQSNIVQTKGKGYVEDPFLGDERILAAQQAIKWILDTSQDGYEVRGEPIKFTSEQIGNNVFVKAEIDIFSKKENLLKKRAIWALNYRGYRLKNEENARRMETSVYQVISDHSNYSNAVAKMSTILETFKFDSGRNVYPDLK